MDGLSLTLQLHCFQLEKEGLLTPREVSVDGQGLADRYRQVLLKLGLEPPSMAFERYILYIYIYAYMYVCTCICVCVYVKVLAREWLMWSVCCR